MAKLSFTPENGNSECPREGVYPCLVSLAKEKASKKSGDLMFEILLTVHSGDFAQAQVKDWIMLQGKAARWHSKKLCAILGKDEMGDGDEVHESDLLGRRVWAYLIPDTREYQGKTYTDPKVNATHEGSECGYAPASFCPWPESGFDPNDPEFMKRFGPASGEAGFDESIPF